MANIHSTDPRKPAIKARLLALAGVTAGKVTLIKESKGVITGHVLVKKPGKYAWQSLGYHSFPASELGQQK